MRRSWWREAVDTYTSPTPPPRDRNVSSARHRVSHEGTVAPEFRTTDAVAPPRERRPYEGKKPFDPRKGGAGADWTPPLEGEAPPARERRPYEGKKPPGKPFQKGPKKPFRPKG